VGVTVDPIDPSSHVAGANSIIANDVIFALFIRFARSFLKVFWLAANEGFDPTMGARPLRRAIQRLIEDPLAEEVLRGTFRPGDTIRGEMDGERVTFRRLEQPIDEGMPPPLEEELVAMA
jgi:hypothetical protein